MKNFNIYFFILLFLVSCNTTENKNQENYKEITTDIEKVESNQSSSTLQKQKSCELFTNRQIAELLNVDVASLKTEDMGGGERRSICYYYNAEGKRKLYIRLGWESDKSIENKVLETQYKRFLEDTEQDFTYQEISNESGNQILTSIQPDRENMYIHIVRKRFGNSAEATLELRHESDAANIKDELVKMINELD